MLTRSQWIAIMMVIGALQVAAFVRILHQQVPAVASFLDAEDIDGRVDLNRATAEDFLRTRRISGHLAGEIIRHRDAAGPFLSVEGLLDVRGIGPKRYERIKDLFKVE